MSRKGNELARALCEKIERDGVPDTIDWQHYRIQSSIAAMSIVADDGYNVRNEQHLIAKYAVQIADALIEELKKGGQDDSNVHNN